MVCRFGYTFVLRSGKIFSTLHRWRVEICIWFTEEPWMIPTKGGVVVLLCSEDGEIVVFVRFSCVSGLGSFGAFLNENKLLSAAERFFTISSSLSSSFLKRSDDDRKSLCCDWFAATKFFKNVGAIETTKMCSPRMTTRHF